MPGSGRDGRSLSVGRASISLTQRREETAATQPLRCGINVSLDACVHHEAGLPHLSRAHSVRTSRTRQTPMADDRVATS
jgi:hypothetical protein